MVIDYYKNLALDYDSLMSREDVFLQESFFKKIIADYSVRTCLDCACGPGWHLYMLNKMGIKCFGSDISPTMLMKARTNLSQEDVELKKENFNNLSNSWDFSFDMIICMTTSFAHNSSDIDAIKTLSSIYECLNKGGVAIIDMGFSDSFLDIKPKFVPAKILQDQAFYFFLEYNSGNRTTTNILHIKKTSDGFDHNFQSMVLLTPGQETLKEWFAHTSFSNVLFYGDFNFTHYDPETSPRIIAVAQK